jgi:putative PIN family toxin of toxin-antitoxin system
MKIIVDTNILVSAIICDNIPEKVILWIISQPIIEWIASEEIMQEYQGVLHRKKFKLSDETIEKWLRLLNKEITVIASEIKVDFPRDRKDAKFLECAIASGADILITGDKDFSEAQSLIETRIMSVSQFNAVFC